MRVTISGIVAAGKLTRLFPIREPWKKTSAPKNGPSGHATRKREKEMVDSGFINLLHLMETFCYRLPQINRVEMHRVYQPQELLPYEVSRFDRQLLLGIGSNLELLPSARSQGVPEKLRRFLVLHQSVQEALQADNRALRQDYEKVGGDMWQVLHRMTPDKP